MKKLLVAGVSLMMAVSAMAGFINEEEKNPLTASTSTGATGIRLIGAPDRVMVYGFGRGMPIMDALSQIVPKGYAVRTIGVSESLKLNWQGGKDWVAVLSEATEAIPGLVVEVNQNDKVVSLKINPTSGATDSAKMVGVREWQVKTADGMISATLRRWGQDAGFQVIWDAPKDFPVMAEAIFAGRFEDAISAIVESLSSSQAPVRAIYYTNNVVRIVRYDGQTADLKR